VLQGQVGDGDTVVIDAVEDSLDIAIRHPAAAVA
jgi:hypothetical protein